MTPTSTLARPVIGRLAPSPTGRLHVGNLSTSLLAWVHARRCGGRIILRIEDVDGPRVAPGAPEAIADDLHWLGIDWDEGPDVGGQHDPYIQSQRGSFYGECLDRLDRDGLLYACTCSRKDISEALSAPHGGFEPGTSYPGTCSRRVGSALRDDVAVRVRVDGIETIVDQLAGTLTHDLRVVPGDFVVRRRDGLVAYQLAVVADDGIMGVTDVVRGADLLDSTPRQAWLHRRLGTAPPRTWHVPMVTDERGERLSKRSGALGRPGLQSSGWAADDLRGALGWLWGWLDEPAPISVDALVGAWQDAPLRRRSIAVPDALWEGPSALRLHARQAGRLAAPQHG